GIETATEVARALDSEHLLLACELMLLAGRAARPEPTAAQCAALIARCEPESLREQLAPLHALFARLYAIEGDTDSANASAARAEQALQIGDIGAVTPQCGLWLAQALHDLGRPAEAALQARHAALWLTTCAQQSVPPVFRASFLHRHPVHQ